MTLRNARANLKGATLALFLGACGTSGSTDAGVDAGCTGAKPTCCASCLNDVLRPAVCSNGAWTCPSGAVTEADCAGKCTGGMFCMYLPQPECVSCVDGTSTTKVCNEDAGQLQCPANTYEMTTDAGACMQDAKAD